MAADFKGVLTNLSNALPTGLDGGRIAQWKMREGTSYESLRADLVAVMNGVNQAELNGYGDLIYVSDTDYWEYPTGGSVYSMQKLTDSDRPQPRKGKKTGHMIDLWKRGDAIGGTEDFFMDARQSDITSTLSQIMLAGRNSWEIDVLTRLTNNSSNQLPGNGSGYDVGMCDASANVTYAPLSFNGKNFTTTHTHYIGYDSGSSKTFADVFDGLALTITEHGHQPALKAIVSESDVTTIRALTNYIKPVDVQWDRGGLTSGNIYREDGQTAGQPEVGPRYVGGYDSNYGRVLVYASNRLPTGYVTMWKPYGVNDPRNPIAVRIHPKIGFGFYIAEIPSNIATWPVKTIEVYNRYGVGSNGNGAYPRTAAATGYLVSGGVFVNPTIT